MAMALLAWSFAPWIHTSAFKVVNLGKIKEAYALIISTKFAGISLAMKVTVHSRRHCYRQGNGQEYGYILYDTITIISPVSIATPMGMMPRMGKFIVVGIV